MSNATCSGRRLSAVRRFSSHTFRSCLALAWLVAVAQFGAHLLGDSDVAAVAEVKATEEAVDLAALDVDAALADESVREYDLRDLRIDGEPELSDEMLRVRDWVASHYRVPRDGLEPALAEAEVAAREAELDPLLIVAMIAVESSFNPMAESHAGALGLMQVIPRWHWDKIGKENGAEALFDPRFNVQVGTLVLVEGLQRYGSLEEALQYYNGARNDPQRRYTRRVMSVKEQLYSVARSDDAS